MSESLGTIWVCIDCMLTHANGECGEAPDREPLNLIDDSVSVTMGMLSEEHAEDCLFRSQPDNVPGDYECECERNPFSWSSCHGCGSALGGERHALTLWDESATV